MNVFIKSSTNFANCTTRATVFSRGSRACIWIIFRTQSHKNSEFYIDGKYRDAYKFNAFIKQKFDKIKNES